MKLLTIDDLKEIDGIYYSKFSGKLKSKFEECSFKNGLKDGSWIIHWENRKLRFKGNYKNNLQEDNWVYYNEDGIIEFEGKVNIEKRSDSSRMLTSNEISYIMEGTQSGTVDFELKILELSFELTKKLKIIKDENKSIYYDKFTGKIDGREQVNFKKGKKYGPSISYLDDGQIISKGNYNNGKKDGYWISYRDNNITPSYDGQISSKGNYKNGKKEGPWISYAKQDGQLESIGNYKNGKKEGSWFSFNYIHSPEGKGNDIKKIMENLSEPYYGKMEITTLETKSEYNDGEIVGTEFSYKNGKITDIINYKKGGWRHGSLVRYYENGHIKNKQSWKNNIQEGLAFEYFENGDLYFKGMFQNGKQNGHSYLYKKDGTLNKQSSGNYKDGKKISD